MSSESSSDGEFLRRPTAVTPGFGVLEEVAIRRRSERNLAAPDFAPRAIVAHEKSARRRGQDRVDIPRASAADSRLPSSGERIKLPSRPVEQEEGREELLKSAVGLELNRMTPSARSAHRGPGSSSGSASSSGARSQRPTSTSTPPAATRARDAGRNRAAKSKRVTPMPKATRVEEMLTSRDLGALQATPEFSGPPRLAEARMSGLLDYDAMFDSSTPLGNEWPKSPRVERVMELAGAPSEPFVREPAADSSSRWRPPAGIPNVFETLSEHSMGKGRRPKPRGITSPAPSREERLQVINPLQAEALEAARQRGTREPEVAEQSRRDADALAVKSARNQTILIGLLAFLLGMGVVWAFFV